MIRFPWNKQASRDLKAALPGTSRQRIKREVIRGESALFRVGQLWAVLRMEPQQEMVVVAVAGKGLKQAAPVIVRYAQQLGARTIRFHTYRKKILSGYPFRLAEVRKHLLSPDEYIYRMAIQ